jgi:hypothetical protein
LRLYQNSAAGQLAARGLIAPAVLRKGQAVLDRKTMPAALLNRVTQKNVAEDGLVRFLLGDFSAQPLRGKDSFYRKAGLPTRAFGE